MWSQDLRRLGGPCVAWTQPGNRSRPGHNNRCGASRALAFLRGFLMKMRSRKFAQASVLAASTIAAATISMPSRAAEELEEIVVTGVRQAQQAAIEVKRDAVQIVDSISAEDIGKLPDVTISDSLQRIPGVQIRRDAGEGSTVAVRGLPQVTTLL